MKTDEQYKKTNWRRKIPLLETLISVHPFLCRIPCMQRGMSGGLIVGLIVICCFIIATIPMVYLIYKAFEMMQTAQKDFRESDDNFWRNMPNIPTRSTGRFIWNQDANGTTPTTTLT